MFLYACMHTMVKYVEHQLKSYRIKYYGTKASCIERIKKKIYQFKQEQAEEEHDNLIEEQEVLSDEEQKRLSESEKESLVEDNESIAEFGEEEDFDEIEDDEIRNYSWNENLASEYESNDEFDEKETNRKLIEAFNQMSVNNDVNSWEIRTSQRSKKK